LKIARAIHIVLLLFGMLPTVELDDQLLIRAAKVRDISLDRKLPAKLEPRELSPTQSQPELRFRRSLFTAETACTLMQNLLLPQ